VRGGCARWRRIPDQPALDEVVTVTDDEIRDSMRLLFDRLKLVTEPSGAAALAALVAKRVDVADARVGVVLSGGNVGVARLCEQARARTDLGHVVQDAAVAVVVGLERGVDAHRGGELLVVGRTVTSSGISSPSSSRRCRSSRGR
jgi:hypothetical protein